MTTGAAPSATQIVDERVERLEDGSIATVAEIIPHIGFAEDRDIWERQDGEPDKAWAAFSVYCSLDPYLRTQRETVRILQKKEKGEHVWTHIVYKWSATYRWPERVRAFDQWVAKQEVAAVVQERIRARKETAYLGRNLRLKAQEALQGLTAVLYRTVTDPETGEAKRELRSSLTAAEIARLADTGAKLERLALDLDHSNMDGTPKEETVGLDRLTINYFAGGAAGERRAMQEARAILEAQQTQAETLAKLMPNGEVVDGEFE